MIRRLFSIDVFLFLIVVGFAVPVAASLLPGEIPPELARWRSWVLHGQKAAFCPSTYNDGTVVRCQWPSRLTINVREDGARFEQRWQVFAEAWVTLPGSGEMWPDGVVVDGQSVAVVNRNGDPSVHLSPGEHQIKGRFYWLRKPEMIRVPPSVGLIGLTVGGQKIDAPVIDAQGRLWLQGHQAPSAQEDQHRVRIFRLIDDTIPMMVTTLLRLDVSGRAREIHLKKVLLDNTLPVALVSELPARLSADGDLLVQARAGRWEIQMKGRMPEPVSKFNMGKSPYGDEVWSFQPRHYLRMVEIGGVAQVEPGQTEMPQGWRQYSAYLVKPGDTLQFKVLRRGDPDPAPDQLRLFRRWWLDFDGKGFTLNDKITGTLSRQWALAVNPPMVLGRLAVDGKDQMIIEQGGLNKTGVELRRGDLDLEGDARLTSRTGDIRAVGWDHDFIQVDGQLHLPPGWRLLAAMGVDRVSDTWVQRWSLLDFFMVLIITMAIFKLRGLRWGCLALATMVLVYHEPGAPRMVWLHILAVLALLPLIPDNWIKRLVRLWGFGAVLVLLIIAIPFIVHQVRWGIYPQLAPQSPHTSFTGGLSLYSEAPPVSESESPVQDSAPKVARKVPLPKSMPAPADSEEASWEYKKTVPQQDLDALIPTGPGLPQWSWQTIRLEWNGPVAKDQKMRLFLLSPWNNLVLSLLRAMLLSYLIWGVVDWKPWWRKLNKQFKPGRTVGLILFLSVAMPWLPVHAAGGDTVFPSQQMLDELKKRLLEPADCLPYCADISRLEVALSNDDLRVILKVHAARQTIIPLPVNRKSWTPDQIMLDNAPISGMARDKKGGLWAVVPAGVHTVVMLGNVYNERTVQIPLPLRPHLASYAAKGWSVKGILPNGIVGSSVQLTRIQEAGSPKKFSRGSNVFPPFLNVRRELRLGFTWQVHTIIERVTPKGTPVVVNLPLLPGESVTTAGLHVNKGHVLINMSSDQTRVIFKSTLKVTTLIQLIAPRAVPWTETWVLDASPVWHCHFEGIDVVHHQNRTGQWQPQWQPWPGETVKINVRRPEAVKGQVLTIQKADLVLSPGRRFSRGELTLSINTSRGGQHAIELPPKTNLQEVRVNDRVLPVRQDGRWVTVPLQPGVQTIYVDWHQLAPFQRWFKAPPVKIGTKAVNANVTIHMPQKRWVLLVGGPDWGPAVLFWSYILVIALVAFALGRLTITPLSTWQWALLGLGMTQIPVPTSLIIVGWLVALGIRERRSHDSGWLGFNLLQLGLVLLTLLALSSLFMAVKTGLLGHPDMQIAGNHSNSWTLNWTQDRIGEQMPRPWVLSLPTAIYNGMMLAWSLWLAYALLGWLKWGYRCFSKDALWKKVPRRKKMVLNKEASGDRQGNRM